jgi:RNA polymerase sigma-70 factor (ECF subfamily)
MNMTDVKSTREEILPKRLKAAQHGDIDAFAEIFESYREMVFAVACRLVGSNDADDVVMETYLKAWQAIPNFRRKASLKTWLYRIANNCALDFVRSNKRRQSRVVSIETPEGTPDRNISDPTQPMPDEQIARSELVDEVREALKGVPAEHRAVLLLRYADGMSYGEIAAAVGVSAGTVMSRLLYGKRKLKKVLLENDGALK